MRFGGSITYRALRHASAAWLAEKPRHDSSGDR